MEVDEAAAAAESGQAQAEVLAEARRGAATRMQAEAQTQKPGLGSDGDSKENGGHGDNEADDDGDVALAKAPASEDEADQENEEDVEDEDVAMKDGHSSKVVTGSNKDEGDEERMCRFCFDGDDEEELCADVCACKGDQRYVHMGCLRRWQRMVLVSQPTHPAFYRDDVRHHVCGVCKSNFTCPPPSRLELMQSFTGAEIAALIGEGRFIAARNLFSEMLEKEIAESPMMSVMSAHMHWIRGAYLITNVEEDTPRIELEVESNTELRMVQQIVTRAARGGRRRFELGGRAYALAGEGALAGVPEDARVSALASAEAPCSVVFEGESSTAHDTIQAVNLTRPVPAPLPDRLAATVAAARVQAQRRCAAAADVAVVCYSGGPCEENVLSTCIIFGGEGGYSVDSSGSLVEAMVVAGERANPETAVQGLVTGQLVELHSLTKAMRHNGSRGVLARFDQDAGRWTVQLVGGAVIRARPENLRGLSAGEKGRVLAFFGYAGWSRAQLLGEIARGHWGLCSSSLQDVCCAPDACREGLESRLVYAPESEMTDDYVKSQLREMENLRQEAQQASMHARGGDS